VGGRRDRGDHGDRWCCISRCARNDDETAPRPARYDDETPATGAGEGGTTGIRGTTTTQ
jgi:hypothetical protein